MACSASGGKIMAMRRIDKGKKGGERERVLPMYKLIS